MVSRLTPLDAKRVLRLLFASVSLSRTLKWKGSAAEEATDITDGDECSLSAMLSPECTERMDGLLLETSKLPCVDLDIDG